MKIGCPNHPRKNLLEEITWIGSQGFEFLDLFFEPEAATPDNVQIDKVGELLTQYQLSVTGHTAWYLPIGSPIKTLRQAAIQEAARTFPLLQTLGGKYVTIHGNWPSPKLFSIDEAIGFQAESLRQLVDLAAKNNIAIM
jgi:sugar phosphate isomerase/epimerase